VCRKFFGKANSGSAKQQSKLSFSTKPKAEKKAEEPKEEPESSPADEKTEQNGKVEDVSNVEVEVNGTADSDKTKEEVYAEVMDVDSVKADAGKKRSIKDEEGQEEDAPPTKRQRRKPTKDSTESSKPKAAPEKSEKTPAKSKKAAAKPKAVEVEADDDDEVAAPVKSKHTVEEEDDDDAVAPPIKSKHPVEDEGDDDEVAAPVKIAKGKKKEAKEPAVPAVDEDESSKEEEDILDSDEEPEDIKKKAREKVQTTLNGTTKDPYPDWKAGDPVPYAALCTTFSKIEMTSKRLEIAAHCSLFLRQVLRLTPSDLLPTTLLMVNKLAADYTGIELGIGESLIKKAISESTGRSLQHISGDHNEIGDLGLVAAKSRSKQPTMFKPKALTVQGVHKGLMAIATIEGQGAQGRKVDGIKKLLSAADAENAGKHIEIEKDKGGPSEAKFIVRTLEGKLRLGLAEKTVVPALAQAMIFHEMSQKDKTPSTTDLAAAESTVKTVYRYVNSAKCLWYIANSICSELPSYEVIIPAMLEHGIMNLRENCRLQPGVPLKPMLAKPTKSITEVLDRFEGKDFTCEYKYDGERAQIHFVAHDAKMEMATIAPAAGKSDRGVSNIFSRNSEDLSKKYPDILAKLPTWVKEGTKSFVLDCETVAWDTVEKKVLPFQQLMTRKRKDVKVEDVKVKVCVFAFDMLYLNGEALVNKSFRERRVHLHDAFTPVEGEFAFAKFGNTDQLDEIQILLEDSVKSGCEGLMVKMLDGAESSYEPSKRSQNWLKVKKDYLAGVGDSLDLVVLGAYFGKGKRTSWYGAFLLACYNPNTQNYESVCNIGTGFSEAILETLHQQLSEVVIDRAKPFYTHSVGNKDQPDVWFEPRYVWEVKTADLTLSPRYKAAADEVSGGGKGISLRFPRFIKERDDKKPDEASTSKMIAEMYQRQESVSKTKGPSVDDDFEY
jgi:DNA ligase-1